MRKPFLKRVAERYAHDGARLGEICFVFPNKRSGTFFRNYLRGAMEVEKGVYVEPEIIDVSEFVGRFSQEVEATHYEALFTLFNCYKALNPDNVEITLERFLYWGEMLLNDFNDVDRYMVDADSLFVNVERLREIGTNYLSEEQLDVIRRYWGDEAVEGGSEEFWKHISKGGSKAGDRFRRLWEVLGLLYGNFMEALKAENLTTRGRLYRMAAERIGRDGCGIDGCGMYVFVGFNVLTTSEIKIFRRLKLLGRAEFYWDFNSPALRSEYNKAGRFIRENMREFPMPKDFDDEKLEEYPEIDIIGVPSAVGQTKMAAGLVEELWRNGEVKTAAGEINTAIVLPDESLFLPMMNSLPDEIDKVNVTMGFPMRLSPLSSLMNGICRMQKNARHSGVEKRLNGYFYEDVLSLLAMPMVQALNVEEAAALSQAIRSEFLYIVSPGIIEKVAPGLAFMFSPLERGGSRNDVVDYMQHILDKLLENCDSAMNKVFIKGYSNALAELKEAATGLSVDMEPITFMKLVNSAVRRDSIPFKGEPLEGIQVMGMLETRALDFENVVILSMNERIFPSKRYTRSFIPDTLRREYGMATNDFQESIYAYYFYRLISRSKKVTLLYDSRAVGGMRNNEPSRYITQLLYLYPEAKPRVLSSGFKQPVFAFEKPQVEKDKAVMDKLMRFTDEKSGVSLSASAINAYINCPLNFYLQYVESFREEDEITDYISSSTLGTIVHEIFEHLYGAFSSDGEPVEITADVMERVIDENYPLLDQLTRESINRCYHRKNNPKDWLPLTEETAIVTDIIKKIVRGVIAADMKKMPFTYIGSEERIIGQMEISDTLKVNIKQFIDRIDAVDDPEKGRLIRIVDYKTGVDKTDAPGMDSLFNRDDRDRRKAMLQLLFYCHVYAKKKGYSGPIQPILYKVQEMAFSQDIVPLKYANEPLMDYRSVIDEFLERFKEVVSEIFDEEVPFSAAADEHHCAFCSFKAVCGVK